MMYKAPGLFLIQCMVFLKFSDAEPTLSVQGCPKDFVRIANMNSCTCQVDNVGSASFSLLWKDPEGNTITQAHGTQTSVTLQFTSVAQRFNTKTFHCELFYGVEYKGLSYAPKIAERPSPPQLKDCPTEPVFSSDEKARCTCTTLSLGRPEALLSWEDPDNNTVKLTRSNTSLILPFNAVDNLHNGKNYSCVVVQTITRVNTRILYPPQVVVTPNDPLIGGARFSYTVNQTVEIKCKVSGGLPDVKQVDFHCKNHADQRDEIGEDGMLTSSLVFAAQVTDNNNICTCQGTNILTVTTETNVVIYVFQDTTVSGLDIVEVVFAAIGSIAAVVTICSMICCCCTENRCSST